MFASAESKSGMWLLAIAVPSFGTQLDADTLTLSVAFRIAAPVCEPHVCRCGANVNIFGVHNLVCKLGACRLTRLVELNDVVKKVLQTPGIPCLLNHLAFHEMMAENRMASQCLRVNMERPNAGIALV